jgi:hypothetical protein
MKVIARPPKSIRRQRHRYPNTLMWVSSLLLTVVGVGLFFQDSIVIRGIPLSLIIKGIADWPALEAYLSGNKQALHARLEKLGFEEEVKAFYRPKIRNEIELDRHIHQVLYDNTGYVGKAYYVNSQGNLTLKVPADTQFQKWFQLASEANVVVRSYKEGDEIYVVSPGGAIALYKDIAKVYSPALLNRLIRLKRQSQLYTNPETAESTDNSRSPTSPPAVANP